MKAIKIAVKENQTSRAIQNYLFAQGYKWFGDFEPEYNDVDVEGEGGFYGHSDGYMGFDHETAFKRHPSEEVFFATPVHAPPIGLTPTYIWKALRAKEILAAMTRYSEADKVIPLTWLKELEELQKEVVE